MTRILVTGSTGMVGNAIRNFLQGLYNQEHSSAIVDNHDLNNIEFIYVSSKDANLCIEDEVDHLFASQSFGMVIHLAANVGGLFKNMREKVDMYEQNVRMNLNVMHSAFAHEVRSGIFFLSTCIFPDCPSSYPLVEEMLHDGPPHSSNAGYAYAKRMLHVQAKLYNEQYGCNFVCVAPTNIYGPHDNFNPTSSHVVAALIERCYTVSQTNDDFVVWGSGKPLRQFIFAPDLAEIIIWLAVEMVGSKPSVNATEDHDLFIISPEEEYSIADLARAICDAFQHDRLTFDSNYADGQYKKTCSSRKLLDFIKSKSSVEYQFTPLDVGIKHTVDWFISSRQENIVSCSGTIPSECEASVHVVDVEKTKSEDSENNIEKRIALITGITGQDGSYLAEMLLEKNYIVYGIIRRASVFNTERIDHLFNHPNLHLVHGDITDAANVLHIFEMIKRESADRYEIYNLAAQSHVHVSFEVPLYTAHVDALGVLNMLEGLRTSGIASKSRFYQASTSELFGLVYETPQKESTPFHPRSPYGVAKLYAYWIVKNYREAYGMFAVNGILFNHESERRGKTFVTRKITLGIGKILRGEADEIVLGNLNAKRDWSHARDMVEAMWLMLQSDDPRDYVASSDKQHSVREFVEIAFDLVGMQIEWRGSGIEEEGVDVSSGRVVVRVSDKYFRPAEVETLLGDSTQMRKDLQWRPKISFQELVHRMVQNDIYPERK